MSREFIDISACLIIREVFNGVEYAGVFDSDGYVGCFFPATWTDEQIRESLRHQNGAYAQGFDAGQRAKADEIRRAIGAQQILANNQA